jgi:hypothetical protein
MMISMLKALQVLILGGALAAGARAETAASLEADADRRMDRAQYELAKSLYKLALQRDPRSEFLWTKYDLAHERYLRSVGAAPRGVARPPAEPARPAPAASARATAPEGEGDPAEPGTEASPSPEETPSEEPPPPTPEPTPPAPAEPLYRSPSELIYLSRPVRAGDTTAVQGGEDGGQQIFVRTPIYEIFDISFQVDPNGSLHVKGKVKNVSAERDLRNPQVFVSLYDKGGVQIAIKPVRLLNVSAVLFRGDVGEFDAAFPAFKLTVGAYRVSLDP